jgi:hypothetical protein
MPAVVRVQVKRKSRLRVMAEANGTIVWYRERFGRGVVRMDDGRQFMFTQVDEVAEVESRLRVAVVGADGDPAAIVVTAAEGDRELAPLPPPPPAPGEKRKRSRKGAKPALPDGTSVRHKTHGQGFVVAATAKMVRVRFTDTDEVRTVRLSSLDRLDGHA